MSVGALPRSFLVSQVRAAKNMEEAVRLLRSPDFDPRREAVVEGAVALPPAPAFLVTSEAHYPGWRAFMEDRELEFQYTNVAFRGLAVPAGRHTILMRFAPPLVKRAAALSAVAWLLTLGAVVAPLRRRAAA